MALKPAFYITIDNTVQAQPLWAEWVSQAAMATANALSPLMCEGENWACSLKISTDGAVQTLNKQFRQKDTPTNVLSFPGDVNLREPGAPLYMGDIIFAHETIKNEAHTQGKTFENHLKHLTVHGVLHLYGYDHLTENDAQIMEELEICILKTLNITNPYLNES